jgi:hypothetical protein
MNGHPFALTGTESSNGLADPTSRRGWTVLSA